MCYTEIKIDKSTLPKDRQVVKFDTYKMEGLIGEYIEEEESFWPVSESDERSFWPVNIFDVYKWCPIN